MDSGIIIGLLEIILINIILSGDNAVVIALACRNLDEKYQKKAVFYGSFGAIALRIVLTFVAVYLLQIPLLNFVGGLLLLYIAVDLLKGDDNEDIEGSSNLFGAIRTIIVADLIMSLDNVVAVAGAANGNIVLIIIGLAVSIPLIIWCSQLLMTLMDKFPIIVIIGAALLGYTAGEMMLKDKAVGGFIEGLHLHLHVILPIVFAILVVVLGKILNRSNRVQDRG
ncbi:TerC family protein [Tuberibacillus sp. Marseille-P3662]|uniref:TerC family protein n=1 Tax=Tuberibacillus sp. Marseille-P3662 TaxID=1965358 RepID=UPI000A1C9CCF|nr:TerC family protein [Tuberibacillus sp. Marseille-P3662]